MADIESAPDGSIILLHGCAHNPTGIDPTPEQWQQIADLCIKKSHTPFFDVAYQGFATGDLEKDAFAPRLFVDAGLETFVAQSYSKNLGLYGERVGAINLVCSTADAAGRVMSQMKRLARALYSNPPTYGAKIAATIVNDKELFSEWKVRWAQRLRRQTNAVTRGWRCGASGKGVKRASQTPPWRWGWCIGKFVQLQHTCLSVTSTPVPDCVGTTTAKRVQGRWSWQGNLR
eukprot:363662-Chlamydomonas_euryale.AAC.13